MTTLLSIGNCRWANPTRLLDEDPPESKPLLEKVKELPLISTPLINLVWPFGSLAYLLLLLLPPQHMPLLSCLGPSLCHLLLHRFSRGFSRILPRDLICTRPEPPFLKTVCLAYEWRSWPAHTRSLGQCEKPCPVRERGPDWIGTKQKVA